MKGSYEDVFNKPQTQIVENKTDGSI